MFGHSKRSRSNSSTVTRFGGSTAWRLPSRPVLLWITDAILVALIIVFPFFMGGREAWGHRILISLSMALGFIWCLHRIRTGGRLVLLAVEPLVLAGMLLVWFQTLPVTPTVLGLLSEEYASLLPAPAQSTEPMAVDSTSNPVSAENEKTQTSFWTSASLYPSETRHAIWILISYGIIASVVAQRLATEDDCYHLLKLIGISGVLMAAFAVVQLITSNDRFFWFYRHPFTGTREVLKGAFTNRNHFAQFLSLSIGPLLWWMLTDRTPKEPLGQRSRIGLGVAHGNHSRFDRIIDPQMLVLVCAVGGILLAIILSLSRGGMISAGLACAVCLAGLWKSGRVNASVAFAILALATISVGGLTLFGHDVVEDRISQLASGDADQIDRLNARRSIWTADIAAIKQFPIAGTGVGSHRFVYPIYMEDLGDFLDVTFSHAESSYIHLALEAGFCGLGLLATGLIYIIGRIIWHLIRRRESQRVAALAAIAAGLVGGAFHAAVDFIWYAPAIVVSTIMLGVAGLRLCSSFRPDHGIYMPRTGWLVLGMVCLFALCRTQPDLAQRIAGERLWHQYLIADFDSESSFRDGMTPVADLDDLDRALESDSTATTESLAYSPTHSQSENTTDQAEYSEATSGSPVQAQINSLRDRIVLLMSALKANPNLAEAHQHLATRCLDLFELLQANSDNRLPLQQIREVVLSSRFENTSEMYAFLRRAFGTNMRLVLLSNQHSRKSLSLCPLQTKAYESLVATDFVRDPLDRTHNRWINQSLRLGLHSPRTRHAIGLTLLQEGRQQEAMKQWSIAFHSNRELRQTICQTLGKSHAIDTILTHFDPSADELTEVLSVFGKTGRRMDIEKLAFVVIDKVRRTESAAGTASDPGRERFVELLMDTYRIAYSAQAIDKCEELLQLAIDCDPMAEPPRRALGLLMLEQQNFTDADAHFAWCCEQLPGDTKLEELRRECRRRAANQATRVRAASYSIEH